MTIRARAEQHRVRRVAEELLGILAGLHSPAGVEEVHRLRTTLRRVEVALQPAAGTEGYGELGECLRRLRKAAGKLRDIDVHLEVLHTLHDSCPDGSCDLLRSHLRQGREAREAKLLKVVGKVREQGFEGQLVQVAQAAAVATQAGRSAAALLHSVRAGVLAHTAVIPEDEARLHRVRIECKRLRYALEPLAPEDGEEPRTQEQELALWMVDELKRVQDSIGAWHDWATLRDEAAAVLHAPADAGLRALLRARALDLYRVAGRDVSGLRASFQSLVLPGSPEPSG